MANDKKYISPAGLRQVWGKINELFAKKTDVPDVSGIQWDVEELQADTNGHIHNSDIHVTAEEKAQWSSGAGGTGGADREYVDRAVAVIKDEIVTDLDNATDITRIAYTDEADEITVPSMDEFNTLKDNLDVLINTVGKHYDIEYIDGYIHANGYLAAQTASLEKTTKDPISIVKGKSYKIAMIIESGKEPWGCVAYYASTTYSQLIRRDLVTWQSVGGKKISVTNADIPSNAVCMRLSIRSNGSGCKIFVLSDENALEEYRAMSEINHATFQYVDDKINALDFSEKIDDIQYERGNLSISATGWDYNDTYQQDYRVRTKDGYTIKLNRGDTIGLTDYNAAEYYIGYRSKDYVYGTGGAWLNKDFIAPVDGEYVLCCRNVPNKIVSNPDDLGKLMFAKKTGTENNVFFTYENKNIRCVNHRGYNYEAPENTIPAFVLSRKKGFEYVETDVSFTSDGIAVLLHDDTINRTARNADGTAISQTITVSSKTYAQLQSYDFGIWKSPNYAGVKIPKFADFMELCKKIGLKPYVEIKQGTYTHDNIVNLCDIVIRSGMKDSTTWTSANIEYLREIASIMPSARYGYVISSLTDAIIAEMVQFKQNNNYIFADCYYDGLNGKLDALISNDIDLEVWTVNTDAHMRYAPNYATGFTTDCKNVGRGWANEYI